MEHIAAFLLIIGCSDDLSQCRELPAPHGVYEVIEECETELPDAFRHYSDRYPQFFAQCFEVDPQLTETDAEIVWEITPEGDLLASVEPIGSDGVLVASGHGQEERDSVVRR